MLTIVHSREKSAAVFLGSAVGDALGWPYEAPRKRESPDALHWARAVGGRYQPLIEFVRRGDYSDDTQLVLATARSLIKAGPHWHNYLANVEFPFWLLYERGGGRTTKASAQSLADGKYPWMPSTGGQSQERYFSAGGNGAAMRILPHVVFHRSEKGPPHKLLADVLRNSILTHGHPRALLGACLHAICLRSAFQERDTLGYGEIIESAQKEIKDFSFDSLAQLLPKEWISEGQAQQGQKLDVLWDQTVGEIKALLEESASELGRGPLASELELLQRIGATERKSNGSGTVSAIASAFIASRYATDPMAGVRFICTVKGVDTDTVASMAASLLGAIHGTEWLAGELGQLQDAPYIREVSSELWDRSETKNPTIPAEESISRVRTLEIENLKVKIGQMAEGEELTDANLGPLIMENSRSLLGGRSGQPMRTVRMKAFGGQSIFLFLKDTLFRRDGKEEAIAKVGVRFYSRDIEAIRKFFESILDLRPTYQSATSIRYGANLVFAKAKGGQTGMLFESDASNASIVIESPNFELIKQRLAEKGIRCEAAPSFEKSERQMLMFRDPEGRRIEVFATKNT